MIHSRSTARRLALTVITVFAVIGLFVVKLVDIQVVRAGELTEAAEARRSTTVTLLGSRGNIVDANGAVLADTVDRFDITASPRNVGATTKITIDGERVDVPTAEAIAKVAELTGASSCRPRRGDRRRPRVGLYVPRQGGRARHLYRRVRPRHPVDLLRTATFTHVPLRRGRRQSWWASSALTGRSPAPSCKRTPASPDTMARRATNAAPTACDCRAASRSPRSRRDGGTVHLTIDADLQWFAQQKLAEQGTAIGADWATAMVVRVDTGEIVVGC